jgi:hypothetical protein
MTKDDPVDDISTTSTWDILKSKYATVSNRFMVRIHFYETLLESIYLQE